MFKNKMLVIAGLLGALALGMSGCGKDKACHKKASHKRSHRMHKDHGARKNHANHARKNNMRHHEHEEKNLFRK